VTGTLLPAVTVPAVEMFPAAVHVHTPVGIVTKQPPPEAVPLKPIGIAQVTIAAVPETVNNGPVGVFVPAPETMAAVAIKLS